MDIPKKYIYLSLNNYKKKHNSSIINMFFGVGSIICKV
jgi:hypothetical protein